MSSLFDAFEDYSSTAIPLDAFFSSKESDSISSNINTSSLSTDVKNELLNQPIELGSPVTKAESLAQEFKVSLESKLNYHNSSTVRSKPIVAATTTTSNSTVEKNGDGRSAKAAERKRLCNLHASRDRRARERDHENQLESDIMQFIKENQKLKSLIRNNLPETKSDEVINTCKVDLEKDDAEELNFFVNKKVVSDNKDPVMTAMDKRLWIESVKKRLPKLIAKDVQEVLKKVPLKKKKDDDVNDGEKKDMSTIVKELIQLLQQQKEFSLKVIADNEKNNNSK